MSWTPATTARSASRARATFEASRSRLNIDSPKNTLSQQHAVQPADQSAVQTHLDAVRVTMRVKLAIRGAHFRRDPGARGVLAPRRAGIDHRGEVAVECHSKATISQRFGKAARAAEFRGDEDFARIRRPPQHRLAGRIPGKDPATVRGQEPGHRQVATGRQQPFRFIEHLVERRKPLAIAIGREPGDGLVHCFERASRRASRKGTCFWISRAYSSTCAPSRRR